MSQRNRRASPLLNGSPSAPSFTGLSLFHDNSRSHLLDDLKVVCGDIKFPVLEKIVKKCGSTKTPKFIPKAIVPAKRQEPSTFSSLRDLFLCRTRSIESSFFDDEKHLQQSPSQFPYGSRGLNIMQSNEKDALRYHGNSLAYSSSSSSRSSHFGTSPFDSASSHEQALDAGRLMHHTPICRRRTMLPLWINTALARIYPSNAESRHGRNRQASFPSTPETISLPYTTSPCGRSGIEVDVDGLSVCHERAGRNGLVARKPSNKWDGNWV